MSLAGCRKEPPLPVYWQIPAFQLTAQSGQPFDSKSLEGDIWVADFIFTTCPGPCPRMSSQMRGVQSAVASMPDVKLVSFTVDPKNDTPTALAAYATRYRAEPGRWFFFTGDKEDKKPPEEKVSQTKHTIQIGGKDVKYTATAGTMLLKKEDGTATASIFYIAYIKDDVPDTTRRPLTFAFNGGPGSSSVWLQLGALGPKRVAMDPEGNALPPPYKLVDNEYSILDLTDLVFIDPVSTGFSRAIPEQDAKNFHGINGDLESVADFIRLYTTRNNRWTSPKFLAGESYGTTRAANLSGYLQQRMGYALNGIMLISAVLNFGTISFDRGNDLPYILFLPTYTATAWYHKKLPPDLMASQSKALEESRAVRLARVHSGAAEGRRDFQRRTRRRPRRSWRA
jgi:carboxypeptidase C (cathepsin A)